MSEKGMLLPSLEIMPAESTTFLAKQLGTYQTAHLYYYLEALPGSSGTVTYNGKQFDLHQHVEVNINSIVNSTKSEDFYDIDGFTQWASNPVYGSNGTVELNSSNNRTIRFYYTRDS